MRFDWTPAQAEFRERLRDMLARNLPADWDRCSRLDSTSAATADFAEDFCPALASEGLLIPHWPQAEGGEGLDPFHHWILGEEMTRVGDPRAFQYMNVNWIGAALRRFGSPAQKAELLPAITQGRIVFCQGFSEPGAGSDLAALETRATRIQAGYRIDGIKTWTSGANRADLCVLLARTGESRRDISVFLAPMDTPGVTVRRIPNFIGELVFHEVTFDGAEIPAEALLGPENQGWMVVRSVLAEERVGAPRYALTLRGVEAGVEILSRRGAFTETAQIRAAQAMSACLMARFLCLAVIDERAKGRPPGPTTSLARYSLTVADRLASEFFAEFLADELIAGDEPVLAAAYRRTGSSGIAAGAAEIQMNAVARDLLGLPKD